MTTATMLVALAAAAPAHGTTTLATTGAAADGLRAQGVRISALSPARATRTRIRLPVSAGTLAGSATLDHGGAVRLRRGRRSVTLSHWQARLGARATLTARVAGRRATVLQGPAGSRLKLDTAAETASLAGAPVTLTRAAASAIKRRLGLRRAPRGALGRVTVSASLRGAPPARPLTPALGGGTTPAGSGTPSPSPAPDPLPKLARPASATNATAATITWHVRDSFIQYINSGEGTSTSGGATSAPPTVEDGSAEPLVYAFHFPLASGWHDAASADAALYYTGKVNFSYRAHGIDMEAQDPEIELNGADSRAIFRMDGAREVLVDLDLTKAASISTSPDGHTHAYERVPGFIPEGTGDSVFAGFYLPGDEFGWVSVQFTTP
jgi:Htaa